MATTCEELLVYKKAVLMARAISAILKRPNLVKNRTLSDQLRRGSVRIVSDIAEGFEQKTDRHFAKYLYDAKGGCMEIKAQLQLAQHDEHIEPDDHRHLSDGYAEIARMLAGLIAHLEKSDWKERGRPRRRDS